MKWFRQILFIILTANIVTNFLFAQCNSPICMSITNVDASASPATVDIHMTNQAGCSYCTDATYDSEFYCINYGNNNAGATWEFDTSMDVTGCTAVNGKYFDGLVGGFQFGLPGVTIGSASGGSAAANSFIVSPSGSSVLAFSMSGTRIPAGSSLLTSLTLTGFTDSDICFAVNVGEITDSNNDGVDDNNLISNASGVHVTTEWGACYCAGGSALDACGECGNNTACLADGTACTADTECETDSCDACGECGGNNTACETDGVACTADTECEADNCDVCGFCGAETAEYLCEHDGSPKQFQFNQSTLQSMYFFTNVTNNLVPIEADDWVAAFKGSKCVGARKWDTGTCGAGICEVPVMGDDGSTYTAGYCNIGDPITFMIYDASEQKYSTSTTPSEDINWSIAGFNTIDDLVGCGMNFTNCEAWVDAPGPYDLTATMTVDILVDGVTIGGGEGDILAAFDQAGNIREVSTDWQYGTGPSDGKILYTITPYGNGGEALTFKYYDFTTDKMFQLGGDYTFVYDDIVGTLMNPYILPYCNVGTADPCGVCDGNNTVADCCPVGMEGMAYYPGSTDPVCVPKMFKSVVQSTSQAYYKFGSTAINNIAADDDDWVGAFKGTVCLGARKWNGPNTDVPVFGYDINTSGADLYIQSGEIPTFRIFDASISQYYNGVASEDIPWAQSQVLSVTSLNGFGVMGCMDSTACNYNPNAELDDGTCYDPCFNGGVCISPLDPSGLGIFSGVNFECNCDGTGYQGTLTLCTEDVDECTTNTDNCNENASCTNSIGSFDCTCNTGYSGDGLTCSNIDECLANTDNCHNDAQCTDTTGSFDCTCNSGFTGDGVTCIDFNECQSPAYNNCHVNADCIDKSASDGGFSCVCSLGYTGNGITCSNEDECTTNTDNCHSNATCLDVPGSYSCTCNSGFFGDGLNNGSGCNSQLQCIAGLDDCDDNATCIDIPGSYTCECNTGYVGDGYSCTDKDECTTGGHDCVNPYSDCINTVGSWDCVDCLGVSYGTNEGDYCDCGIGITKDCANVCGGSNVEDNCGICDDNNSNDCGFDCADGAAECIAPGMWDGTNCWGGISIPDGCAPDPVCDPNPLNDNATCKGCMDKTEGSSPDIYGNFTCGNSNNKACFSLNYDPDADFSDGSCLYPQYGCTDDDAVNYWCLESSECFNGQLPLFNNAPYVFNDGSCIYPAEIGISLSNVDVTTKTLDILISRNMDMESLTFIISGPTGLSVTDYFGISGNTISSTLPVIPIELDVNPTISFSTSSSDGIYCLVSATASVPFFGVVTDITLGGCVTMIDPTIGGVVESDAAMAITAEVDIPQGALNESAGAQSIGVGAVTEALPEEINNATGVEVAEDELVAFTPFDLVFEEPVEITIGTSSLSRSASSGDTYLCYLEDANDTDWDWIAGADCSSGSCTANIITFGIFVTCQLSKDCHGELGGTAYLDICGRCVGGNTGYDQFMWNSVTETYTSNTYGCTDVDNIPSQPSSAGEIGCLSRYKMDECGLCDGPGFVDWWVDADLDNFGYGTPVGFCANGVPSVPAYVPNDADSDPNCGTNDSDDCGLCGGSCDENPLSEGLCESITCTDSGICEGICEGGSIPNTTCTFDWDCPNTYPDKVGACANGTEDCVGNCLAGVDCQGICGGPLLGQGTDGFGNDVCGVCDGDCDGTGIAECGDYDCFGACKTTADCFGVCGGIADPDICGNCNGGVTVLSQCSGLGCMDGGATEDGDNKEACNYNYSATAPCASCCIYSPTNYDCQGDCIALGTNLSSDWSSGASSTLTGTGVDCAGACGGNSAYDLCITTPVCDDDNTNDQKTCTGCMDTNSCNFESIAEFENASSCSYPPDPNYDCFYNCAVVSDCAGTCAGAFVTGACSVCENPNLPQYEIPIWYFDSDGDGLGDPEYSNGYCTEVEAEIVKYVANFNDEYPSCKFDYYDCNTECANQATASELDCSGICGGVTQYDDCYICGGDNIASVCEGTDDCESMDCAGACFEEDPAEIDGCGHCGWNNQDCSNGVCADWGCVDNESCWNPPAGECDCYGNILDCAGACGGLSTEQTLCKDTDGDDLGNPGSETEWCYEGIPEGWSANCTDPEPDCFYNDMTSETWQCEECGCSCFQGYDCLGECMNNEYTGVLSGVGVYECTNSNYNEEEDCVNAGFYWSQFGRDACGVCNGSNECFDCSGVANGGAFINACADCECSAAGSEISITDGCAMPPYSLYIKSDGKVLYNSGDSTFTGINFTIDGATLDTNSVAPGFSGDIGSAGWLMDAEATNEFLSFGNGNNSIGPKCGTLVRLNLTGIATGLSNIVVTTDDPPYYVPWSATFPFAYYVPNCVADSPCSFDCAGTKNGSWELDECGICREPNCMIEVEGPPQPNHTETSDSLWVYNPCDEANEYPTNLNWNTTCTDCIGTINGDAVVDMCGHCIEVTTGGTPCSLDCQGIDHAGEESYDPNKDYYYFDLCGVCDNDHTNDCAMDCFGYAGGASELDDCGICNGFNASQDCAGVCVGDAVIDHCGDCVGGTTLDEACSQDCAGEWYGDAVMQDYYLDYDGDALVNQKISLHYCSADMEDACQPDGPVGSTGWCYHAEGEDFDVNDMIYCLSNDIDCADVCDGGYVWDAGEIFDDENDNNNWDEGEEIIEESACCHPDNIDETGICEELSLAEVTIPDEFSLHNIYPNPFNPSATIVYALPEYSHVKVTVYDIRGRTMAVLTNGFESAGYYTIQWDASAFASGVYFIEMNSDSFRQTRKVLHIK